LTLKKSFLSGLVSSAALPGTKANLAVTFSAGAPLIVEVVQWDVPVFSSTTSKAAAGSDLKIPVTYKGLPRVAAVKIVRSDGSYPFDDWTKYLGPLQQGRGVSQPDIMDCILIPYLIISTSRPLRITGNGMRAASLLPRAPSRPSSQGDCRPPSHLSSFPGFRAMPSTTP